MLCRGPGFRNTRNIKNVRSTVRLTTKLAVRISKWNISKYTCWIFRDTLKRVDWWWQVFLFCFSSSDSHVDRAVRAGPKGARMTVKIEPASTALSSSTNRHWTVGTRTFQRPKWCTVVTATLLVNDDEYRSLQGVSSCITPRVMTFFRMGFIEKARSCTIEIANTSI